MSTSMHKTWRDMWTDDLQTSMVRLRGGCSCHLYPPCFNCSEPLTEEEAEELGLPLAARPAIPPEVWRDEKVKDTDFLKAVRDMCRGQQ